MPPERTVATCWSYCTCTKHIYTNYSKKSKLSFDYQRQNRKNKAEDQICNRTQLKCLRNELIFAKPYSDYTPSARWQIPHITARWALIQQPPIVRGLIYRPYLDVYSELDISYEAIQSQWCVAGHNDPTHIKRTCSMNQVQLSRWPSKNYSQSE